MQSIGYGWGALLTSPHPTAHVVRGDPPHRFTGGGKNHGSQSVSVLAARARPSSPGHCERSDAIQRSARKPALRKLAEAPTGWLRFTRHDEKRRRNADKRIVHPPRHRARRASTADKCTQSAHLICGRARLSAFHRGSRLRDCSSRRLSVGPCFLGLGRSVRSYTAAPTGGRRPRAAPRALPRAAPVPVQWCTPRAGRSAGRMMPKPPGNGPYPPARGHRTRSAFRNTFAKGVLRRARFDGFCNCNGDRCQ